MSNVTVDTPNSPAQNSKLVFTNAAGQFARVDSVATTSVDVDNLDVLNLLTEYDATNPGMLVIISGQASGDTGKTANITGISGTTITVDTDLSSALGADDIVAVVPPLAVELETNGGHTLGMTVNKDDQLGLTEALQTHNSLLSYDVGGQVPIFTNVDSISVARMLLAATGAHKVSTSQHTFVPIEVDDGSFTQNDEVTIYSSDANGVYDQVFLNLFASQTVINVPNNGISTISQTYQGSEAIREVGGTGKTFPSGSNNWDTGAYPSDRGKRFAARGAFLQIGGSFGAALDKSLADPYFTELTITMTRGGTDARPLGNPARAKTQEDTFGLEITGRRILEDATLASDYYGDGAAPDDQAETRLLVNIVNPADETKFLKVDVPRGVYNVHDVQRQRGQFEETFTYTALQTLDASQQVDTSNPLFQIDFENGDSTDIAAAVA